MSRRVVSAVLPAAAAMAGVGAAWVRAHRRSAAATNWRRSALPGRRQGPLYVRTGGSGDEVVVLLHGLVASGEIFGAEFDELAHGGDATLVVPDLLGFGRSLDEGRARFGVDDHLDALDRLLYDLDLDDRPLLLGGHSMGASLALNWALRHRTRVRQVSCWGPPVYRDPSHVHSSIAASSPMARLFVADTRSARSACRISCSNRTLAGLLAAATTPALPVEIARMSSLHTWPAYRDAIDDVVAGTDWRATGRLIVESGAALRLTWGAEDPVGDQGLAREIAGAEVRVLADGDHRLPLSHGLRCTRELSQGLSGARPAERVP